MPALEYRVTVVDAPSVTLEIEVTAGLSPGEELVLGAEEAWPFLEIEPSRLAPAGPLRYRARLGDMARQLRGSDTARRAGTGVLLPLSSFLPHPRDLRSDAAVSVHFDPGESRLSLRSGADVAEDELRVQGLQLRRRCFVVVAECSSLRLHFPTRVEPNGAAAQCTVQVVWPEPEHEELLATLRPWLVETLERSASLWNGMPLDRLQIAMLPTGGRRGILFGRTYPGEVPTLMLLTGSRTRSASDVADDWMLAHETLHLGFPPVTSEARWLDEGLATYYEPLLRAREGLLSERELWQYLVRQLPRGVPALTRRGLRQARGIDDIYWGGGLYLLLLDVEVRRRSAGERKLSDALRALLDHGWDIGSRAYTLDELLDRMQIELGPAATELRARFVERESDFDLVAFLDELGVRVGEEGVLLDDDAPAARWRRALLDP